MRAQNETSTRRLLCHWLWALAVAIGLFACATDRVERPRPIETRDASGFRISSDVRIGDEVRTGYVNALRLLEQKDYEAGIAELQKVTERAPQLTVPHIDLAIAYGWAGDLERAEASLESALELNPRHPVAHNELGMLYRRSGRFDEARRSYEQALSAYPDFHFAHRNLAILCDVYLAEPKCALEHYEKYARVVPEDQAVAMWIADLRARGKR